MLNQQAKTKISSYKKEQQTATEEFAEDKNIIVGLIQSILEPNANLPLTEAKISNLSAALAQVYVSELNEEQNRFKGFVYTFAKHLRDLAKCLRLFGERHALSQQEILHMETEIRKNTHNICNHMNNVMLSKELMKQIDTGLKAIDASVRLYKEHAEELITSQQRDMRVLQDQLMETERGANKIKNMLSLERLKNNQDLLTGIANRAAYDERIKEAYNRWQRGFGELSLMIADIDHFKDINDTYGHLVGDKILKDLAHILKASIRAVDFIAHYGGGEFVFIFERTRAQDATKISEALSNILAEHDFQYSKSKIIITMSYGITSIQHGDDANKVFVRADQALYQAKCNGGNGSISL